MNEIKVPANRLKNQVGIKEGKREGGGGGEFRFVERCV